MNQPALGAKIAELRSKNGMTQKELSNFCNVDIRTIQRIEMGEVVPRAHTLKLLATSLGVQLSDLNEVDETGSVSSDKYIKSSFISGIIFSINAIPTVYFLVTGVNHLPAYLLCILFHTVTSIFFFRGFYYMGKRVSNRVLEISSFLVIILLPLLNLFELSKTYLPAMGYQSFISTVGVFIAFCITLITFGIGLWMQSNKRKNESSLNLFVVCGALIIVQAVLMLSLNLAFAHAGLVISIFTNFLLVIILYRSNMHPANNNNAKTARNASLAC
ncbi:MAG: helix-turn-helix transcriptional regulator [Chitinophagaceae bacterium]